MAAFNVERCIAVVSPFISRKFTFKRTVIFAATVVASVLAIESCSLVFFDLKGPGFGLNPYCNVQPSSLNTALLFLTMQTAYDFPILVMALFMLRIYIFLQRRNRVAEGSSTSKISSSSVRIMLIISVFHIIIFCPYGVLYTASMIIPTGTVSSIVRYVANFFIVATSIITIADFTVYLINLPSFRDRVLCKFERES